MRKFLIVALLAIAVNVQGQSAYFLSNPCLTPDGQTVIFSFEGDLWKANVKDGQASRITAMQGYETSPRVSPSLLSSRAMIGPELLVSREGRAVSLTIGAGFQRSPR